MVENSQTATSHTSCKVVSIGRQIHKARILVMCSVIHVSMSVPVLVVKFYRKRRQDCAILYMSKTSNYKPFGFQEALPSSLVMKVGAVKLM